jgi:hypothetical protein
MNERTIKTRLADLFLYREICILVGKCLELFILLFCIIISQYYFLFILSRYSIPLLTTGTVIISYPRYTCYENLIPLSIVLITSLYIILIKGVKTILLSADIYRKNILDYENKNAGIEEAILIIDDKLVESKNNTSIFKNEIIFILMITIFSPFLLILSLWHFNIPILISASAILLSILFGLFSGLIIKGLFKFLLYIILIPIYLYNLIHLKKRSIKIFNIEDL